MLAEIYLLKLEAAVRAAKEAATTASTSRFVPVTLQGVLTPPSIAFSPSRSYPGFRTIAPFGDFARTVKHMRFPAQTRESPHVRASTRAIAKHRAAPPSHQAW